MDLRMSWEPASLAPQPGFWCLRTLSWFRNICRAFAVDALQKDPCLFLSQESLPWMGSPLSPVYGSGWEGSSLGWGWLHSESQCQDGSLRLSSVLMPTFPEPPPPNLSLPNFQHYKFFNVLVRLLHSAQCSPWRTYGLTNPISCAHFNQNLVAISLCLSPWIYYNWWHFLSLHLFHTVSPVWEDSKLFVSNRHLEKAAFFHNHEQQRKQTGDKSPLSLY